MPGSRQQNSPPSLQHEESDHPIPVWLLAIGGMGEAPTQSVIASMQQEAERLLHHVFRYPDTPIRLAAFSWRSLLVALIEERRHIDSQPRMGLDFIIADLIDQTWPRPTLLVKSKTRGKAVVHTTFEGQRDRTHSSGVTCPYDVADWARRLTQQSRSWPCL
jgi:hypothetical protein